MSDLSPPSPPPPLEPTTSSTDSPHPFNKNFLELYKASIAEHIHRAQQRLLMSPSIAALRSRFFLVLQNKSFRRVRRLLIKPPNLAKLRTITDELAYIFGGALKGFLVCFTPLSIMRMKLSTRVLRRALAIASFTLLFRTINRITSFLHANFLVPWRRLQPVPKDGSGIGEKAKSTGSKIPSPFLVEFVAIICRYHTAIAAGLSCLVAQTVDRTLSKTFPSDIHAHSAPTLIEIMEKDTELILCWMVVRAVRFCYDWGSLLPPKLIPFFFMSLSSAHILSSWVCAPDEIDPLYLRFLYIHGGHPRHLLLYLGGPNRPRFHCTALHPSETCSHFSFRFFKQSLRRSTKLYFPLSVLMVLASRDRSLLRFLTTFFNSTMFLTTYCTSALVLGCFIYKFVPGSGWNRLTLLCHTWTSGLALIFEPHARRVELSSYVSMYALDSVLRGLKKRVSLPRNLGNSAIGRSLIMICSAIILQSWKQQPKLLTEWLLGLSRANQLSEPSIDHHHHPGFEKA